MKPAQLSHKSSMLHLRTVMMTANQPVSLSSRWKQTRQRAQKQEGQKESGEFHKNGGKLVAARRSSGPWQQ